MVKKKFGVIGFFGRMGGDSSFRVGVVGLLVIFVFVSVLFGKSYLLSNGYVMNNV